MVNGQWGMLYWMMNFKFWMVNGHWSLIICQCLLRTYNLLLKTSYSSHHLLSIIFHLLPQQTTFPYATNARIKTTLNEQPTTLLHFICHLLPFCHVLKKVDTFGSWFWFCFIISLIKFSLLFRKKRRCPGSV